MGVEHEDISARLGCAAEHPADNRQAGVVFCKPLDQAIHREGKGVGQKQQRAAIRPSRVEVAWPAHKAAAVCGLAILKR